MFILCRFCVEKFFSVSVVELVCVIIFVWDQMQKCHSELSLN